MKGINLSPTGNWNFSQKLLFRFLCVYFLLYTFPLEFLLKKVFWNPLISWTAEHALDIGHVNFGRSGSGDTTYGYVQVFCMLVIAAGGALLWSLLDRKRKNYSGLLYWTLVCIRYFLAIVLLSYGFAKITQTQFPFPSLLRLVQTYGDSSPMGLAWTFMGYSAGFNLFTGLAEALGGVLLFFRRTTTFGALLSMTVLGNIVAMNFFYDIPVKLFSVHLLLMAIFIIAPDIPRLTRFFFTGQAVPAGAARPVLAKRWMRIGRITLKTALIAGALVIHTRSGLKNKKRYAEMTSSPLYGIYEVTSFERNTRPVPPLATDSTRWDLLIFFRKDYAVVRTMTGQTSYHRISIDTVSGNIKWENSTTLAYKESGKDSLTLAGRLINDSVRIRFRKKDPREFTLVSRGFHWINEYPFNR